MTERFPLPVERYTGDQARTLGCERCGFERVATGDEVASYSEPEYHLFCECGEGLCWKYQEADRCPGCGRLGWWHTPYESNACSRACHFQAEYAQPLATASKEKGEARF